MPIPRTLLPVLAAATLVAIAGCASEAGTPESPTSQTGPATGHGGLAHCLSEHGVTETAVSPVGPPDGVDQATWDTAMQACSSLAPGPATP